MREEVEKMSADTTAPHLLYCLDYQHKSDPCSSFNPMRVVSPFSSSETHDLGRKRKGTIFDDDSDYLDDDDAKSFKTDGDTKSSSGSGRPSNHSEIEKRRRDKMNGFITDISSLIPMCTAMPRKLDKLTVLRLAVQHIKTLRGSVTSYGRDSFKPSFMSDEELKEMLQKISDGFLMVFSCDRGKIIHVSENVVDHLNMQHDELLGQSFVDIVHPKDIPTMKHQMTCFEPNAASDKLFSQKTSGTKDSVVGSSSQNSTSTDFSIFSSGAKRTFLCRLKRKSCQNRILQSFALRSFVERKEQQTIIETNRGKALTMDPNSNDKLYRTFYCCGFLKSWQTNLLMSEISNDAVWDTISHFGCLVLLMRPFKTKKIELSTNKFEFTTRLSLDGRFLYTDQAFFTVLGYVNADVLGSSYYEYIHQEDLLDTAEFHKQMLETVPATTEKTYRLKKKNDEFINVSTKWTLFKNPWTKEAECFIVKQRVVSSEKTRSNPPVITIHDNANNHSTLSELLSQLPTNNLLSNGLKDQTKIGSGKIGKIVVDRSLSTSRNYGTNKSVTISTSEPISQRKSFQKQACGFTEKQMGTPVIELRSSNINLQQKEHQEQTALSVVMNILEADNHVDYTEMLWPL